MPQIKARKDAKGNARYTALVRYKGLVASQTFSQRKQADLWGHRLESAVDDWIRQGRPVADFDLAPYGVSMRGERRLVAEAKRQASAPAAKPKTATVRQLLEWYQETFTSRKALSTRRREDGRIRMLIEHLGDITLDTLTTTKLRNFNEARMDVATSTTIKKDLELLASAFKENAQVEPRPPFPEIADSDLFRIYIRPKGGSERSRRLHSGEEDAILFACESGMCGWPYMPHAFRLAVETAMRQTELTMLTWRQVDLGRQVIKLGATQTKNKEPRTVPFSTRALAVLNALPQGKPGDYVLPGLTANDRSMSLRGYWIRLIRDINERVKALEKAEEDGVPLDERAMRDKEALIHIDDLVWHDLRHEATSRLFEDTDLKDMEIMSITGHKSYSMLKRYANLRANKLVARLG